MLFVSAVVATVASAARELTPADFDDVIMHSGKGGFVKFFAPWCGHCKSMKPAWDNLEKEFINSDLVTIADVDCTSEGKALCQRIGVKGYPTIRYFIGGEPPKGKDYSGGRSFPELKTFVTKTFKPACKPSTGENCSDAQKAIVGKIKGKDVAAELATFEEKLKTKKSDRSLAEADFKKKVKVMKGEEKELQETIAVLKSMQKESGAETKDEL